MITVTYDEDAKMTYIALVWECSITKTYSPTGFMNIDFDGDRVVGVEYDGSPGECLQSIKDNKLFVEHPELNELVRHF